METMRKQEEDDDDDETEDEVKKEHIDADNCGTAAIDYASLETDIQAQRVVALEENRLDAAIEELLRLESQLHCAADVSRTRRVVMAIIQLCYEARAWKTLNDQIRLLSQRQPQLQQVVKAMVQQAAQYIDDAPDMDTRNELIETLNNISSGKGLRKICWYVVLHPDGNLQADPSKSNSVEMLKQADPPRACELIHQQLLEVQEHQQAQQLQQERSLKRKYEKCNVQFQDKSLEELESPTCESRPNTPPPSWQLETTKAKEIPRLPSKMVATTTTQRTPRMVRRRRLFDSPSPAEMEDFFSEFEERERKRFTDRYNFDPLKGMPLPGRFEWVSVQSQSITPTSTGIRRSSTV